MQQVQGLFLSQRQVQVLSQKQLQSLALLSLSSDDLRQEIYKAVEENPALTLRSDKRESGVDVRRTGSVDYTRLSSKVSAEASLAGDAFQAVLEAQEDTRQSLTEHLLSQVYVLPLSVEEMALCERLIYNIDENGFHILAPVSLLHTQNALETEALLEKCLAIIQKLDPVGTCTKNTEESLLVQAREKNAPPLVLFLLSGHLDFISPPQPAKAVKKIHSFLKEKEKLFGGTDSEAVSLPLAQITEEAVQDAIECIRRLDPFPARNFGTQNAQYVLPDVAVSLLSDSEPDVGKGIQFFSESTSVVHVHTKNGVWSVELLKDTLPRVSLNKEFADFSKDAKKTFSNQEGKMILENLKKAQDFLEALSLRQSSLLQAVCAIVLFQSDFFKSGPGFLKPLRQKDLAEALNLHESTISRLVNSKYIRCSWGLFELKYFFSHSLSVPEENVRRADDGNADSSLSKDAVLREIKRLLEEGEAAGRKKMSDQKIADALSLKGIHISRRTVAKYREQLNIASSYER